MIGHILPPLKARGAVASVAVLHGFARQIADHYHVAECDAFDALSDLPPVYLAMLDHPEGWSAVADYIAQVLGGAGDVLVPTIH